MINQNLADGEVDEEVDAAVERQTQVTHSHQPTEHQISLICNFSLQIYISLECEVESGTSLAEVFAQCPHLDSFPKV